MMSRSILPIFASLLLLTAGCGKISPISPELKQDIENQGGQIDDLRNNQNGLMIELGKVRQQNEITAEKIDNFQQGAINIRNTGDGLLVLIFAVAVVAMILVYHYRTESMKHAKTADILAQQVALHDDNELNEKVYMAALNTEVETQVYKVMQKNQR